MRLVYDRKSGGDIACALGISKSTVQNHLAQARRALGVTRSITAAEMLHAFELRTEPSCDSTTYPALLTPDQDLLPIGESSGTSWGRVALPLRSVGASGNGLSIAQRIVSILVVAIAIAIGFGSLANGFHVVTELVGGFPRR